MDILKCNSATLLVTLFNFTALGNVIPELILHQMLVLNLMFANSGTITVRIHLLWMNRTRLIDYFETNVSEFNTSISNTILEYFQITCKLYKRFTQPFQSNHWHRLQFPIIHLSLWQFPAATQVTYFLHQTLCM